MKNVILFDRPLECFTLDYDTEVRSNKNRFGVPDAEMFALQNGIETKRYFLCFGVTKLVFLPKLHRKKPISHER